MSKIRVLIVDDSVVVRKIVADVLSTDPELEVAAVAANGRIGLAKFAQLQPDIVTLDVEMPDMDGLEMLAAIRRIDPTVPIIMFSSQTERGAKTTLEALSRGATDYVTKPTNVGNLAEAQQRIREELIPRIKAFCRKVIASPVRVATSSGPIRNVPRTLTERPATVLAIGCSTGGPNALRAILADWKADLPVPVVIVQHMPPVFTKQLAVSLTNWTGLNVTEASDGDKVVAGGIYIAPGDNHMTVVRRPTGVFVKLERTPPVNACRPAVDVLFQSVAEAYGPGTIAAVLTGMGKDGLRGCDAIRQRGGRIVVQDEATSVVWGMPGSVATAGLADAILPLGRIGTELDLRVRASRRALVAGGV